MRIGVRRERQDKEISKEQFCRKGGLVRRIGSKTCKK
jgi:hypothetical protein